MLAKHLDLYRGASPRLWQNGYAREILCDLVRAEFLASKDKRLADGMPRELVVQFVVGAFTSVLVWWLDARAKLPPHDINAAFRRLATEGI